MVAGLSGDAASRVCMQEGGDWGSLVGGGTTSGPMGERGWLWVWAVGGAVGMRKCNGVVSGCCWSVCRRRRTFAARGGCTTPCCETSLPSVLTYPLLVLLAVVVS